MIRIGDFSRLARVTIKTLHHYDEAGLLTPALVDRTTGYRYYEPGQLESLQRILLLKDLGFTLEEIRDLVGTGFDAAQVATRLDNRRHQLHAQIEVDQARLRRLDALHAALTGSHSDIRSIPAVTLREVAPVQVHFQRRRVARLGAEVQEMFESAEAAVARVRARADASPFLIFHDREYREADADVEACIPVKAGASVGIETRIVPAASAGCVTYRGAYDQTPVLYEAVLRWIGRSGLSIAAPLREVYHRFGADQSGYRLPQRVLAGSSADYITELQAPVAAIATRGETDDS
jgi:DNA-binding transcriptional MerR regulator/effector-binding domain-containing protein